MTLIALVAAWIFTAALVSPAARPFVSRLVPRAQTVVGLGSTLALILIPVSAAVVILLGELSSVDGTPLARCGRVIAAIIARPGAQPLTTAALATLVATPLALAGGFVSAWRSTRAVRPLLRGATGPLVLIRSDEPIVFTVGLIRPRVVVSEGFLGSSDEDVRRVVLAHEEAHRRGRHPLILFAAEGLARAVPILPLRWASADLRFALEAVADERAAGTVGSREIVAETIAGVALEGVPAFCGFEGNEVRRVRRLLSTSTRAHVAFGLALAAALIGAIVFAGSHAVHCGVASLDQLTVVQCRMAHSS